MDEIKRLLLKAGYKQNLPGNYFWWNFDNTRAVVFVYDDHLAVTFSQKVRGQNQIIFSRDIEKTEGKVRAFILLVNSYNQLTSGKDEVTPQSASFEKTESSIRDKMRLLVAFADDFSTLL